MSGRTGVWRRPRTKVYDANFNAGESYYKSALDGLDRKYGKSSVPAESSLPVESSLSALRASLERERPARRPLIIEDEVDEKPRRKPNTSALLDEFDSIFEGRTKNISNGIKREKTPSRALKVLDDEADQEFEESMKRIRAARSARAAAADMEEIDSNLSSRKSEVRAKLNFSSKLMDSVGMSEDSSSTRNKKVLSIVSGPTDSEDITRWSKLDAGRRHALDDTDSSGQAAARALKSRARLEDLESEMAELEQRGAAREKRVRDLRSLLSENESNSKETINSTVRVKSTIKTEKKQVAF